MTHLSVVAAAATIERHAPGAVAVPAARVVTATSHEAVETGAGVVVFATTTINGQVVSRTMIGRYAAVIHQGELTLAA